MKKHRNLIVLLLIILFLIVFCTVQLINNHQRPNPIASKLETPSISTCSNNSTLDLQLRYITQEEELGTYSIAALHDDVSVSCVSVQTTALNTKNMYTFLFRFTVPQGDVTFDLKVSINDTEFIVKEISNTNFNITQEQSGKSFVARSAYTGENNATQTFLNEITLDNIDLSEASFHIIGEEIVDLDVVNDHSVSILSENNHPAVVGYYYVKEDQAYCIDNAYHTEYLEFEAE